MTFILMSASFPAKSESETASALTTPRPKRLPEPLMSRKFLYRRSGLAVIVILALLAVMAPGAAAQGKPQLKRPEPTVEKLPEARKPKKEKPKAAPATSRRGS